MEEARFKLGISGSLNDRIVNSVKLSMEIHGRGPTTFVLLLALGLMPLVVAIPHIVLKKAIKGIITKSDVSDTHHQPAEWDRSDGETNEAGAVMEHKQTGGKKCCRDDFSYLVAAYLTFDPGLMSPSGLISRTEPLPSSAANNMPSDITPLSLRGSRLATNTTKLPVSSSLE